MGGPSLCSTDKRDHSLCDFSEPVAGYPCLSEVVLFNVAGDCFGTTFRFVRLIVVIHIIGAKAIQGHVRSPAVIPSLKFVAQLSQMISSLNVMRELVSTALWKKVAFVSMLALS